MLLRNFLTKFSLLESTCPSPSPYKAYNTTVLLVNHSRILRSKSLVHTMGCSMSKGMKSLNIGESARGMSSAEDDFVEDVVCKDSDIQEKEMKVFDLQDAGKVLLVRQNGKLSALGNKCTHYGAPLVSSALGDGRIRCQWHGACFDLATGDIEDFPGLDSLPCYQVTVENDNVKVRARRSELESNKRVRSMAKRDPNNSEHFVVIGGGPSGAVCVERLRQDGFQGKITLVAREKYLPYDRIKVNKSMDVEITSIQLRKAEFYAEYDIDVITGCEATGLDTERKQVALQDGRTVSYDAVYIATGCNARKAEIPGSNLKNVIVLRDYDHAVYTQSLLGPEKHVVVLGSSFIGMEAAAYCVSKVESVTVVTKDSVPFQASLGPEVGAGVMKLFEAKGVHFVTNSGLKCVREDEHDAVKGVELVDGSYLKADICIMGIGSVLNTDFLKSSGIVLNKDGSIEVNEYLQTNVPNVFAGGDVAHAPVWSRDNAKATIGHYGLAQYHGKMAAQNMLNKQTPIRAVPYFWTMWFGKGIRYSGHGRYDDIIYSGDVAELKFVAFYLKGDDVVAISSCQMDPIVSKYAEYVASGKRLHRKDLAEDPLAWSKT